MRNASWQGFLVGLSILIAHAPGLAAPSGLFDVTGHGAVGDGETLETKAIQAAIDACATNGGGTVWFPAGQYLTGTLFLKDHVRLDLDMGARILGTTDVDQYPPIANNFPSRTDRYCLRALIRAEGVEDIVITGSGTIDGQGAHFKDNRPTSEEYEPLASAFDGTGRYLPNEAYVNRPYLIQFVSCSHVRVEGVRLRNSAMWMQHYLDCDFVTIRGIDVYNHGCRNNDMIDIDCCRNVVIADCFGDTDDDALTLKSTGPRPTENVVISNCVLSSHCNAIKAGTESSGGFKNIAITNCVIRRSAEPEGLSGRPEGLAGIALEIVDGGSLEGLTISNVTIEGTSAPLFLRLGNRARPPAADGPKPPVGTFRSVSISNVVATGAGTTGCAIAGIPGHPIQDVSLSNVRIRFQGGGVAGPPLAQVPEHETKYPECTMFGDLPAYGLFCRHVEGLSLRDITLSHADPDPRPAAICDDVRGLRLDGFRADGAPNAAAQIVLSNTQDVLVRGCVAGEAAAFLRLENHSKRIAAAGNQLHRAAQPFSFDTTVPQSELYAEGNPVSSVQ